MKGPPKKAPKCRLKYHERWEKKKARKGLKKIGVNPITALQIRPKNLVIFEPYLGMEKNTSVNWLPGLITGFFPPGLK